MFGATSTHTFFADYERDYTLIGAELFDDSGAHLYTDDGKQLYWGS